MVSQIESWPRRLHSGYYNYLLVCLIILFAFRPYDKGFEYLFVWKTFFTLTFFTAIFNCNHHRNVKMTVIALAIPTLVFSWLELFYISEVCFLLNVLFTIAFLAICTASILFDVILYAKVTVETLRGVVCAYFMIAFLFAFAYYLVEFLLPGSFHLLARDVSFVAFSRNLSEMMYFSFVTLLTIGFGDITPLRDISQTLVVIEGIIGQFYIAILVARIVSIYSFYSDKKLLAKAIKSMQGRKSKS
jgi:voltage-gated potassium channel